MKNIRAYKKQVDHKNKPTTRKASNIEKCCQWNNYKIEL